MSERRNLLKQRLLQIINKEDAQTIINEECKKYLKNTITAEYPELANKFKLIIENMSVPMQANVSHKNDLILFKNGILLTFTVVGTFICDYIFTAPIIGTILGFSLGVYFVDKRLVKLLKKDQNNVDKKSQVDSICIWIDTMVDKCEALCDLIVKANNSYSPKEGNVKDFDLETKFSRILEWFHGTFETIEGNEWLEEDITKLLNGYGYGFIKYTEQKESWFDKSIGYVERPVTSVPALINLKTQKCLIKGHAIMPR